MRARRGGVAAWSPLSPEARSLIASPERDGLAWGYVSLSDGAAAQRCAFGVACRPPDLFTMQEQEPETLPVQDRAQADFGF